MCRWAYAAFNTAAIIDRKQQQEKERRQKRQQKKKNPHLRLQVPFCNEIGVRAGHFSCGLPTLHLIDAVSWMCLSISLPPPPLMALEW
jgi:hypothetical protein